LSTDPLFVEKVRDIAGLYLSPPNAPLSCAFRAFLNVIEANVPGDLDVHVITDTVSTYKTQAIRNWFAKRPRWRTHYTPTSASRISLVERFFANLTEKQTRRGAHRSTEELEAAIVSYIDAVNAKPRPFVWTKSADDILASLKRFCAATLSAAQTQNTIATTFRIRTLVRSAAAARTRPAGTRRRRHP